MELTQCFYCGKVVEDGKYFCSKICEKLLENEMRDNEDLKNE